MVSKDQRKPIHVDQPHMACPVGNFTYSISYLTMKPINQEDKDFEDMAHDLEMITGEFIENHDLTPSEMHGVMLAQIVRYYIDNDELDHVHDLLSAVIENVEERMDNDDQ